MATQTLALLRADLRNLILESVAHYFSDSELNIYLNWGIRDFSSRVLWYSRIVAVSAVANQFEYTLPSDILKLELARWQEQYRIQTIDEAQWSNITFRSTVVTGIPNFAFLYPHDKRVGIFPRPNSASPSTTIVGALTSSATTIPVTSSTTFPSYGYALLTTAGITEQVRYFAKDATNLLQVRRGDGDTVAAAHNNLDPISVGELTLHVRALPPDLSADGDIPKLPDAYIEAIVLYAAYRCYWKRQMPNEARAFLEHYLAKRDEASREREQASYDIATGVKDEEYGAGWMGEQA